MLLWQKKQCDLSQEESRKLYREAQRLRDELSRVAAQHNEANILSDKLASENKSLLAAFEEELKRRRSAESIVLRQNKDLAVCRKGTIDLMKVFCLTKDSD